ncbi:hypothetical protein GCM10022409_26060 [Hymenobacter glaciei]|uniref:Bacteriocin n=1 Tax=Hymenobacter glaciei TaxID=877209 RepID=A0ABP7UAU3_9BACT
MNELLFEKREIVELSHDEMMAVDGGTTPVCAAAAASSLACGMAAMTLINAVGTWYDNHHGQFQSLG